MNVQAGTRQSNIMLGFSEPYFLDRPLSLGFNVFHSNYKYDQARELYGDRWMGFKTSELHRWLETAGFKRIEISVVSREEEEPFFETILAVGEK